MSNDTQIITLLLDIKQQQGVAEQQLLHLTAQQLETATKLDALNEQVQPLATSVKSIEPEVEELKAFRIRVAAYVWLGGAFVAALLAFLWDGLKHFWPEIKRLWH